MAFPLDTEIKWFKRWCRREDPRHPFPSCCVPTQRSPVPMFSVCTVQPPRDVVRLSPGRRDIGEQRGTGWKRP